MSLTSAESTKKLDVWEVLSSELPRAIETIYDLDRVTPLQLLENDGVQVWAKREDLSKVHSYKWRGAFNKMSRLVEAGKRGPFVAASAGNHAQGVAIAAKHLNCQADIFMPKTTPLLKVKAVEKLGGALTRIHLFGDCFDEAAEAAGEFVSQKNAIMIKPFDDLDVIAGQGTVGLETLQQNPNIDRIYVAIGGGGLASGIGFAVKRFLKREIEIIGVEVVSQDSMRHSIESGQIVNLNQVNPFCDGTAVRQPGDLTFAICRDVLDRIELVTNSEVSLAAQFAWESGRFIPEPSGAVALAAAIKNSNSDRGKKVCCVVSGANTDFRTIPKFVRMSGAANKNRRHFRFRIEETNGSLIGLLNEFMSDMNIVDFQYGKSSHLDAHPVLGIEAPCEQLDAFFANVQSANAECEEIDSAQFTEFRVIPFRPELCSSPLFVKVDFPDRPGMLRELMQQVSEFTNICYFNYVDSGESVGSALIGFEDCAVAKRLLLLEALVELKLRYQAVDLVL